MTHYHIRSSDGVTIDWLKAMPASTQIPDGAHVYAVNAQTGHTVRVR